MKFSVRTEVASYQSFRAFAEAEQLQTDDLIVTNEFIYNPLIKDCQLSCQILFQERYGKGEPNDEMIDAIKREIPAHIKRIIAVGGGTVIDIAKILVFGGEFTTEELFTTLVRPPKIRALLVVPTTCGTGSEVTNLTIVELKALKTKKGLGLPEMYPDQAALIPEMLKSLPYQFFATSSIDALIHAIESLLSPKSSIHSEIFAQAALRQILTAYRAILQRGKEQWTDWAESFLSASNFAGIAFGNAGVGAVHALSYPLGGAYHIPHGEANQLMFMAVFKAYKAKKPDGSIVQLEQQVAAALNCSPEEAFRELERLLQQVLPCKKLREYGITREELVLFSKSVISGQQRLLANNYVPLTESEILAIYEQCY